MKYAYTILYVQNVSETLAFYEKAFGFVTRFITPEKDYGELVSGEVTIAFASHELGNSNFKKGYHRTNASEKPLGAELVFTSEDIEKEFDKAVEAGAYIYEPLKQKPWGQTVGYLRDINGFLVEVCTPIKMD